LDRIELLLHRVHHVFARRIRNTRRVDVPAVVLEGPGLPSERAMAAREQRKRSEKDDSSSQGGHTGLLLPGRIVGLQPFRPAACHATPTRRVCGPSCASRNALVSRPPAKPVSSPADPITRWHGATIEIGFLPLAAPTARTASGLPICRAICA